jgi:hypothetical protein
MAFADVEKELANPVSESVRADGDRQSIPDKDAFDTLCHEL